MGFHLSLGECSRIERVTPAKGTLGMLLAAYKEIRGFLLWILE